MNIQLTGQTTLGQLQEAFHAAYPFLRLAFFRRPHAAFRGSPAELQIDDPALRLDHLLETRHEGRIDIDPKMLVMQVEQMFEKEFGLHVQVMRKSGGQWLVTSATDDLTLQDQNDRGAAFNREAAPEEDFADYREQE
jgi:hypothetical protein